MRVLEDLWYGNIDTADYGLPHDQEYKELYRRLYDVEEKLKATMNDEQKKMFSKYIDVQLEILSLEEWQLFKNSFSLGARMMLDVMGEN